MGNRFVDYPMGGWEKWLACPDADLDKYFVGAAGHSAKYIKIIKKR